MKPALLLIALLTLLAATLSAGAPAPEAARLLSVRKLWDRAPHNAFTDLIRFKRGWVCVFREGRAHVSDDGAIRVLASRDGDAWTSAARLTMEGSDLRDAKLSLTPDGRLMLVAAGAYHQPAPHRHQTYAWFSTDAVHWGEPTPIGEPDYWLWRVTWRGKTAFGVGYHTVAPADVRLYRSEDGRRFDVWVPTLFDQGSPNETKLLFLRDGTGYCLLRRDGGKATAQLGVSRPPYREWTWKDLGIRLGGPNLIRLRDGRFLAAGRVRAGGTHTGLLWLNPEQGTLTEFLRLPSGGDCSYPGLVMHRGRLWVSYYSSHEGKTSIYLAQVKLPPARPGAPR